MVRTKIMRKEFLYLNRLREMVREIDYAASLDNRFGHKMLAVCYGVILGQLVVAFYLDFKGF